MIKKTFDSEGAFVALNAAHDWCYEHGVSCGSMCGPLPIGLLYGEVDIAKWRNLTAKERKALDGTLTGDMRNGPVVLEIKEPIR